MAVGKRASIVLFCVFIALTAFALCFVQTLYVSDIAKPAKANAPQEEPMMIHYVYLSAVYALPLGSMHLTEDMPGLIRTSHGLHKIAGRYSALAIVALLAFALIRKLLFKAICFVILQASGARRVPLIALSIGGNAPPRLRGCWGLFRLNGLLAMRLLSLPLRVAATVC